MGATLGDILLVFLGDAPGTAHELHQRHVATFGPHYPADITRIVATLGRQGRYGYVNAAGTPARSQQRTWQLTDAGDRRRLAWLADIRPDAEIPELLVRALLAVEATDRATYESVIDHCSSTVDAQRRLRRPRRWTVVTAADARAEFARAETATLMDWLRTLRTRPRARDRVTRPAAPSIPE